MGDDEDGINEVEVPWVDGVLEGAFGALRDEYWGGKFEGWRVWWCDVVLGLR